MADSNPNRQSLVVIRSRRVVLPEGVHAELPGQLEEASAKLADLRGEKIYDQGRVIAEPRGRMLLRG